MFQNTSSLSKFGQGFSKYKTKTLQYQYFKGIVPAILTTYLDKVFFYCLKQENHWCKPFLVSSKISKREFFAQKRAAFFNHEQTQPRSKFGGVFSEFQACAPLLRMPILFQVYKLCKANILLIYIFRSLAGHQLFFAT